MQRARLALILISVLASACLPSGEKPLGESQSAIVGGTTDTGDPGVVLLIGQQPGSSSATLCTGEVVSAHVVLTAAHCVAPSSVGTGLQFQIFLGNNLNDQSQQTNANYLDVKETHYDTAFNINQLGGGHDIAVAVTQQAIPVAPLPVNRDPMTASDVGTSLRLVGYGITSTSTTQDTSGVKRQVKSALGAVDSRFLQFGDAQHNTCEGDSGGPAFITRNGMELIAGVTSFGDQNCQQNGTDTRVDSYWSAFIAPAIMAADGSLPPLPGSPPPSVDAGGAPTSPDGTSTPTSSGGDDGGITAGQLGGDNRGVGFACTASTQCASGLCASGSNGYCTVACVPSNPNACPAGMQCGSASGGSYCLIAEHGCSAGARSPAALPISGDATSALLVLGLFGLLGLLQRRRFRAAR